MVGKEKCPRCGNAMSRMAHGSNQVDVCRKCSYTVNTRTGTVITAPDFKFGQSLFLNCPSCNARLRTKKNNGIQDLDCPYCLHRWRFDTGAPSPDAPTWQTKCPQCGELYHINKNEGARKITCPNCQKIWRFQSDTGEYLPDADVSGSHILVTCPKCRTTNRVPAGKGNLRITCGGCTHKFYLSGDPALAKKQAEPSYSTAVPKASVKSEAHHEEDIPQAGFFTGVKTFFQKSKEAAEDRKSREAAEIRLAENSLLVYLFGTKQIEVLSQQDAYEMFADPTVGGMDIDVQADGFRIRWFTKDWKVIDTTTMTFRHIKDINTDEWGASVIDPLLEHLEFPAARAAMQRVLMTDYIGKIPYLNVNPKIGRVTFNGKPYGAVWEAADKAQSDSSNPSAANKSQTNSGETDYDETIRMLNSNLLKMICTQQAHVYNDEELYILSLAGGVVYMDVIVESDSFFVIQMDAGENAVFTGSKSYFSDYYERARGKDAKKWGERMAQDVPPIHSLNHAMTKYEMAKFIAAWIAEKSEYYTLCENAPYRLRIVR